MGVDRLRREAYDAPLGSRGPGNRRWTGSPRSVPRHRPSCLTSQTPTLTIGEAITCRKALTVDAAQRAVSRGPRAAKVASGTARLTLTNGGAEPNTGHAEKAGIQRRRRTRRPAPHRPRWARAVRVPTRHGYRVGCLPSLLLWCPPNDAGPPTRRVAIGTNPGWRSSRRRRRRRTSPRRASRSPFLEVCLNANVALGWDGRACSAPRTGQSTTDGRMYFGIISVSIMNVALSE